jgi:hypothetical protein
LGIERHSIAQSLSASFGEARDEAAAEMSDAIRGIVRFLSLALIVLGSGSVHAADAEGDPAASLGARYEALVDQLRDNPFHRPLVLESSEISGGVAGDVYALVDYPFATVQAALKGPDRWCDILILHVNTKYCRASMAGPAIGLQIGIGSKNDSPPEQAYGVNFTYRVDSDTQDYLKVRLVADHGPLSTRDYRVVLEAIPVEGRGTFLHLRYSNAYGLAGRLALQAYLGTVGRSKVGFTVVGAQSDGQPRYVGGLRGVVERNSMRYYLAVESFLGALSSPPDAQLEKRLHDWFAAAERYPLQLQEMQQGEYLDMKRKQILWRESGPAVPARLVQRR